MQFSIIEKHKLQGHIQSKHEGVCYNCTYCGYKALCKCILKDHIKTNMREFVIVVINVITKPHKHQSWKFILNQNIKESATNVINALRKQQLKYHIESKHDGIYYNCNECGYTSSFKGNLKTHIKTKHEGTCYSCKQCGYISNHTLNLERHIVLKHDDASHTFNEYKLGPKQHL